MLRALRSRTLATGHGVDGDQPDTGPSHYALKPDTHIRARVCARIARDAHGCLL